jgi:hypothetical protein
METILMSRLITTIGILFVLLTGSTTAIAAQGTPVAGGGLLAELGLPEVVITADETGFVIPDDVAAGTILLTLENTAPFPMGFSLIQLPEGVSPEELMPPAPEAGATPAAEGPPPEEGFPPVLYDSIWAGGAFAMPGATGQSVVTLTSGEWLLVTPPDAELPPQSFTVSGEAGETADIDIETTAIELDNFQINLPDQIQTGPQVFEVTNTGEQPHEMFISMTPERLTVEEAEALLLMAPDAAPDPNLPNPEEFVEAGFILPISPDKSSLVEMNMAPGHYVAVCFLPDQDSSQPHAALGMVTIFSVGAEGEEVEPPASPVPAEHASH